MSPPRRPWPSSARSRRSCGLCRAVARSEVVAGGRAGAGGEQFRARRRKRPVHGSSPSEVQVLCLRRPGSPTRGPGDDPGLRAPDPRCAPGRPAQPGWSLIDPVQPARPRQGGQARSSSGALQLDHPGAVRPIRARADGKPSPPDRTGSSRSSTSPHRRSMGRERGDDLV
jgi:hypothetical protein